MSDEQQVQASIAAPPVGTPLTVNGQPGNLVVGNGWIEDPSGSHAMIPVILVAMAMDGTVRAVPMSGLAKSRIVAPA